MFAVHQTLRSGGLPAASTQVWRNVPHGLWPGPALTLVSFVLFNQQEAGTDPLAGAGPRSHPASSPFTRLLSAASGRACAAAQAPPASACGTIGAGAARCEEQKWSGSSCRVCASDSYRTPGPLDLPSVC